MRLVGGKVLDGQAVGLDDLLVHGRLLLVVGRLADGGEDFHIAIAVPVMVTVSPVIFMVPR